MFEAFFFFQKIEQVGKLRKLKIEIVAGFELDYVKQ